MFPPLCLPCRVVGSTCHPQRLSFRRLLIKPFLPNRSWESWSTHTLVYLLFSPQAQHVHRSSARPSFSRVASSAPSPEALLKECLKDRREENNRACREPHAAGNPGVGVPRAGAGFTGSPSRVGAALLSQPRSLPRPLRALNRIQWCR